MPGTDPTDREPLRLFLPGAFAGLADELRRAWAEVAPETVLAFHEFIPSGLLAREIVDGARADVFVSANRRFMDEVCAAGRVADPRRLAGNRLCAIVLPDRAREITSLDDLLRPGVRVVTPQAETDPCGQYVAAMWQEAGHAIAVAARSARGELVHSRGSGDLPAFVLDGRADAGVFYASEARALGNAVAVVALPPALDFHDRIAFWIGAVAPAHRQPVDPRAEAFVEFLTGPVGQRLLADHGFLPADP